MAALQIVVALILSTLPITPHATNITRQSPVRPNILFAIADDWSWPHAGAYGDKVVKTPTFDRVAREGVLFTNVFCASPSCTPSRGAILTGRPIHQLEEGGNLWSILPKKFATYPDILEAAGYAVGFTRKGWSPGSLEGSGRTRNPAGPQYKDFATFRASVKPDQPWCFWFGSTDPHRPYVRGSGAASGMNPADVIVPPYLPDTPEVRNDLLDYYFAVYRYDRDVGEILKQLEANGGLDNTIVVMTGDNGLPFPRAKTNLYDAGCHLPLAIRWPAKVKSGRVRNDLISFTDFAPTLLDAAGLKYPPEMTGKSFLDALVPSSKATPFVGNLRTFRAPGQDLVFHMEAAVFLERERHANVRKGDLSYPCRAVRTKQFLYIRNFRPDRWPAGDPEMYRAVGPFGDIDPGPSKSVILDRRSDPAIAPFFKLACAKRPAEELYDVRKDPWDLKNLADDSNYTTEKKKLRSMLDQWMKDTDDPRAANDDDRWDKYPYVGPPAAMPDRKIETAK